MHDEGEEEWWVIAPSGRACSDDPAVRFGGQGRAHLLLLTLPLLSLRP